MNYLAHLFLARPTADSHFGNLLGDFRRGVDINTFGNAVRLGLKNHYEVDRFTDRHETVLAAKTLFHKSRRRFAPVALDIYFDHLLIKHWATFTPQGFDDFRGKNIFAQNPDKKWTFVISTANHFSKSRFFGRFAAGFSKKKMF